VGDLSERLDTTTPADELSRRAAELAALEAVAQSWEESPQRVLHALKTGIEALNAEAFRRLIRALRDDEAAAAALRRAVRDDALLYGVLHYHGLVKAPVEHRVALALDEVRPMLAGHGGDVELVAVKLPDTVELRMTGSCQSCPASHETLTEGIEAAIRRHAPEIVHVVRVSRGAAADPARTDGAQVLHFVSPFARGRDAGWTDLCALDELPDGDIAVRQLGGRDLLLYRRGDAVAAYDNACAHMGMPLDGGELDRAAGTLRCPYHGFTYQLDSGECLTVREVQLATHAVQVRGDRVALRLA
jgi:nitrite reductase/ring-hydroxylating ferredoxin subunit/Fe-S cluster biogenesis protein NfuA